MQEGGREGGRGIKGGRFFPQFSRLKVEGLWERERKDSVDRFENSSRVH